MKKALHDEQLIQQWQHILDKSSPTEMNQRLYDTVYKHIAWREAACINLLASEAPMSLAARRLLASPLSSRTAAGQIGQQNRLFAGAKYIDDIEALCHTACKHLFKCNFVEHRVLGGTQACQIVQASMLKSGDTVVAISPSNGGDSSNHKESLLSVIGVNIIDMPFENDGITININDLKKIFFLHSIKMCSIGLSVSVSTPNYQAIIQLCKTYNVFCHADCAHELGLIAGEQFPNPLTMGVDVMTGSTGKTLSGPQGGLILWNKPSYSSTFIKHTFPFSVGGYQNNRILALTLTLLELLAFGKAYMTQVMKNAQLFASILNKRGYLLFGKKPYLTDTHQVIMLCQKNAEAIVQRLESVDIITSPCNVINNVQHSTGVRFGLVECTRLGMKKEGIEALGQSIVHALENQTSVRKIKADINQLRKKYKTIYYCHTNQLPK